MCRLCDFCLMIPLYAQIGQKRHYLPYVDMAQTDTPDAARDSDNGEQSPKKPQKRARLTADERAERRRCDRHVADTRTPCPRCGDCFGDVVGALLTLTASERLHRSGQRCWAFNSKHAFAAKLANQESQKKPGAAIVPKCAESAVFLILSNVCVFAYKRLACGNRLIWHVLAHV